MKVIYCDDCGEDSPHHLIREEKNLYKCNNCGTVKQLLPEKEIRLRAIISKGNESEVGSIDLRETEKVGTKDELVIETNEGFKIGQITSIELKNGKRVDSSEVRDILTIWLRDIGEMAVHISLHKGRQTVPFIFKAPGETEFVVDEVLELENKKCRITKIKLDNGKLLDKAGQKAKTKEIVRIYAVPERKKFRRFRGRGRYK